MQDVRASGLVAEVVGAVVLIEGMDDHHCASLWQQQAMLQAEISQESLERVVNMGPCRLTDDLPRVAWRECRGMTRGSTWLQ